MTSRPLNPDRSKARTARLVLVTGPSGAGRSTAIKGLEDMGFEAIDNLPLSLIPRLFDGPPLERPIALGIDPRTRDFSAMGLLALLAELGDSDAGTTELLYLDCRTDVLLRRFSETRRRHPLAPAEAPEAGIRRELDILSPLKARADALIDTSDLTPHDLREEITRRFDAGDAGTLAVSVQSFSYKRGLPHGVDTVFDVRFLRNPYWVPDLRGGDGRDAAVAGYVSGDPLFKPFFARVTGFADFLLPAYLDEGKAYVSIGFGCTGGQHRSVFVAERFATALAAKGWRVSIRHRELERRAAMRAQTPISDK